MGRISMFLRYRKLCFALQISILQSNVRLSGNVFSIQYSVFFAHVTILCIDSILYIYKYLYIYNIKYLLTIYNHRKSNYREKN